MTTNQHTPRKPRIGKRQRARLIAAAPELLAALQELMPLELCEDVSDEWSIEFQIARAAIAKATGA